MKREVGEILRKNGGVLPLAETFVHRFYPDLNRLGQKRLKQSRRQFIPERWIGSSIEAVNPKPLPSGGLSMIAGTKLSLRDAVRANPELLGEQLVKRHGAEFRVLVKILDPGEPIVFHLHANDARVKSMRRNFRGHRFGKDEAYYFLEAPKGPMPYTHVGLHAGLNRRALIDAVRKGPQYALEYSPAIYQEYETGFFVPAGVPHRPGTALTLEIQQPSDVYTLLETRAGGKEMAAEQIHPGFKSLEEAVQLVDFPLSYEVGKLKDYRLSPSPAQYRTGAGEVDWIFPLGKCRKFGGKRLQLMSSLKYSEQTPFVLFVWKGRGRMNGIQVKAGFECFVPFETARQGVEFENDGDQILEMFTFFPGE